MSTIIIAGGFTTKALADEALSRLRAAGVRDTDLCEVRVSPASEHDHTPLGGDPDESIVRILHECGADPVERAEGTWAGGEWADFDPLRPPNRVAAPSSTASASPSR